jgi:hypothetical protein
MTTTIALCLLTAVTINTCANVYRLYLEMKK